MCKVSTLQCYKSIFKHPNVLCFTVSWLFILTIKEYTSELCHLTTGSHLFLSKPSSALNRMRKLALLDGLLGQRCKLLQHGCFFSFRFSFFNWVKAFRKRKAFSGRHLIQVPVVWTECFTSDASGCYSRTLCRSSECGGHIHGAQRSWLWKKEETSMFWMSCLKALTG